MINATISISNNIEESNKNTMNTKFSEREIEVIACLIKRMQYKEIAFILDISPNTVKNHITSIGKKTGCSSRSEIIKYLYNTNDNIILPQELATDNFIVLKKSKFNKKNILLMLLLLISTIFLFMKTVLI